MNSVPCNLAIEYSLTIYAKFEAEWKMWLTCYAARLENKLQIWCVRPQGLKYLYYNT